MRTAEEVRKEAMAWTLIDGGDTAKQMLLDYADLLEALEDFYANPPTHTDNPAELIRQRAVEKARKG